MIVSILILGGSVLLCLLLIVIAICLMPKSKPIPPRYDFSSDDKVEFLEK